jgi:serine/threonine-protein kinase
MAGTEHLTNDGFMVGTPAYMAPEQVLAHEIDGRADLYAMGVVLFRLLTTKLPFTADSGIAMAQKQLHDQPTPVRQFRMELPETCDEIFGRALAKAPHDRFQTAEDFRAALVVLGASLSGMMPSPSVTQSLTSLPSTSDPTGRARLSPPASPTSVWVEESAATVVLPARRRRNMAWPVALGAVLLVGVPLVILMWRGNAATSAAPTTPPASIWSPFTGAPAPTAAGTTVGAKNATAPAASGPSGVSDASASRPPLPNVTFAKLRLLVIDGSKSSDRDASLRLGADELDLLDGEKTIQSAAYRDVVSVFQSHSREPRWATADGAAVPVARVSGGIFGFLRSVPDWITVQTKNGFIPLRVQDRDLVRVIAELEARTGSKIVRTR